MTVFVSDTFTDSDSTELSAHTPDVGDAWVKRTGTNTYEISSNTLVASGSGLARYSNSAVPAGNEYDITVDWTYSAGAPSFGVVGRYVDENNFYYSYHGKSNGTYHLYKIVSGVWTELDTLVEAYPGGANEYKLEVRDATKKVYIASVEKLTSGDNTLTSVGMAGITGAHAGAIADNFSANDVGEAGAENASMQPMHHWWPR